MHAQWVRWYPGVARRAWGPAGFSCVITRSHGAGGLGRLLPCGQGFLVFFLLLLSPPPNYYYSLHSDLPAGFVRVKRRIATKIRMR